jgi:hypothetical protein
MERKIKNTSYILQVQSVTSEEFQNLQPEVGALVLVDNSMLYIGVSNREGLQWGGIQLSKP